MKSEKVIAYVDGFNLYFGLRDKGWRRYYWLDIKLLCQNLLRSHQHLILVKYFTSRIKASPDKRKRQSAYIEALNTVQGIKLYYGKYQLNPSECRNCGHKEEIPEEKMTDVRLAVEMVSDAYQNKYDTAFLVSGDIDLVPSVEIIRSQFPHKRVIVIFPPLRTTDELRGVANGYLHITESLLTKSLFPEQITKLGGQVLKRPLQWV
ncbi:hypothetical protein ES703_54601 [subsurface metagenome]